MMPVIKTPNFARLARPLVVAGAVFGVAGCSLPALRDADADRLDQATYGMRFSDELPLFDGSAHMARGSALLLKPRRSLNDIYFARSAFEHAALLRVDDPAPLYLVGYTNYLLGDFTAAGRAFASAANLEGTPEGWWLASMAALRNGHEVLGQAFFERGQKAGAGQVAPLRDYMDTLFNGPDLRSFAPPVRGSGVDAFACTDKGAAASDTPDICAENIVIELFVVERSSEAGSQVGQDLVADLSLGLNGTLLDLSRESTHSTGWEIANGTTDVFDDKETVTTLSNALTVDLAGVNYALSFAADADSVTYVSATPVISARIGEEAKLFLGQNTHIIPANSDADPVESETGMKVQLEVEGFDDRGVSLSSEVEFSTFSLPVFGANFARVEKESASVSGSSRIRYNQALLMGSVEVSQAKETTAGQKGLRNLPVFGSGFGQIATSTTRNEVAILATVRPPLAMQLDEERQILEDMQSLGVTLPQKAERAPVLHRAPRLDEVLTQMGVL